ncbi:hypothetical protein ASPZODRAFT_16337 [Penicilliopsis zonata CBS 506.65]|uniref:Cysteine-rich transmembrane CYSTM domain-containing protein n=1 Tax=Penicilliopsis zonata CBS 506.65 TaxID=1073090 RepID=A0A1L9SHR3_9EURO|nr:hypothetical protein ASPZODRAFT_16337 [Penicilliopsis zonata CBS 506.65]OJJ46584.1 hypothetical protein ASPZODRAFT_16337 [Penicilliopsis zonata CBS 506.65]
MFGFSLFSSSKSENTESNTWDPKTLEQNQPSSPAAPEQIVSQQPATQEQMQMSLRGGGEAGFCCGLCAGIACFECCECCC